MDARYLKFLSSSKSGKSKKHKKKRSSTFPRRPHASRPYYNTPLVELAPGLIASFHKFPGTGATPTQLKEFYELMYSIFGPQGVERCPSWCTISGFTLDTSWALWIR